MTNPELSIIVVTLNAESELRRTLDSVANQTATAKRYEVIVFDGGSSDNTVQIAAEHPLRPTLFTETDDGIYDAMNRAAARAHAPWLHFLNAGDSFTTSEALESILDRLEQIQRTATLIVGARNMRAHADDPVPIPNIPHRWLAHLYGIQPHCHQATILHAATFRLVGGYDLDAGFAADHDLIVRFTMLAPPETISATLIDYEGGGMSEANRDNIPHLLHNIRVRRLSLTSFPRSLDWLGAQGIGLLNRFRIWAGATKARTFRMIPKRAR